MVEADKVAIVVVIDPEVMDVFPDALSVNEALRALAPVIRRQRDDSSIHKKTPLRNDTSRQTGKSK